MAGHRRIYMDHNASSPLRPEAREAMLRLMDMAGNPSSVHAEGRALKGEIESARRSVAKLVGAEANQVFFTSGATEAANWAVGSSVWGGQHYGSIDFSATEHACMYRRRDHEQAFNYLGCDQDGIAQLDEGASNEKAILVLQAANSETGVVQPRAEVADFVTRTAVLHIRDAVQAVGRLTGLEQDGVHGATIVSSHKLGGPQGVGALVVRHPDIYPDEPLIGGGGQERRQRAGTENVVGIAGFGAAAEAALRDLDDMPRIRTMRDRLEAGLVDLSSKWGVKLHIFGYEAERLPNTSCFAFEGVSAQTALMSLDLDGFAVSSGSACSSGKVGPSHVLKAMGVADDVAMCAIRVSLGWTNVEDDVPAFLAAYERILARSVKRAA